MHRPKRLMDAMISSPDSNELFNALSHLIGALLSICVLAVLVIVCAREHHWLQTTGFVVCGLILLGSFLASGLLHGLLLAGIYQRIFGILDHCAIYLLIAGTYTPLCLTVVRGTTGWLVLAAIWSLALVFSAIKARYFARIPPRLSMFSYLLMGWVALLLLDPLARALGRDAMLLIATGGLIYSLGALVFAQGKPNPLPPYFGSHEIWHVTVFSENAVFGGVMLLFVLPYPA